MPVVAMTHEMGSLAKDVALQLAQELNLAVMRHEVVDHVAIGRVYGHEAAIFLHHFHQPHHLPVVDHQRAFIGHEGFEGGNSLLFDHFHDFLRCAVIEIRDRHVVGIIAKGVSIRFSLPRAQGIIQAVSLCLKNKVNDHGGATVHGCQCTRFVGVAAGSPHKGHIQMHVRVNSSGEKHHAFRIDHRIGCIIQIFADCSYLLSFDIYIRYIIVRSGDNSSVFNENGHS